MADDWKPGDLALVLVDRVLPCPSGRGRHTGENCPRKGAVREVVSLRPNVMNSGRVCGCVTLEFADGRSAITQRCRKVTPEAEDAFDREVIDHMAGQEVENA